MREGSLEWRQLIQREKEGGYLIILLDLLGIDGEDDDEEDGGGCGAATAIGGRHGREKG